MSSQPPSELSLAEYASAVAFGAAVVAEMAWLLFRNRFVRRYR